MKKENIINTQLNNILEIAANLITEGKATEENAIEMAIELDNNKSLKLHEDISDMRKGYINELNGNQKGFNIVLEGTYNKLSKI